jgi:nucleoside-diphosphate-sugar epimerase
LIRDGVGSIVYYDRKLRQDILDHRKLQRVAGRANVTIHLAGLAHPGLGPAQEYAWTNVVGCLVVLDHAVSAGHERFVFVSSGAVYGWDVPGRLPVADVFSEDCGLELAGIDPYTGSKVAAEQLVSVYAQAGLIHAIILRLAPIWNVTDPPSHKYWGAAVSPRTAVEAIANSLVRRLTTPLAVYNVADPMRRGRLSIDRALADGIVVESSAVDSEADV